MFDVAFGAVLLWMLKVGCWMLDLLSSSTLRPPLVLSFSIALCATALVAATAIPLAFFMARRSFPGKSLLEALIIVPLVLPPTVVGYLIIVLLGRNGVLGQYLDRW